MFNRDVYVESNSPIDSEAVNGCETGMARQQQGDSRLLTF